MLKKCSIVVACMLAFSLFAGALCFAETTPAKAAADDLNGIPIEVWPGKVFLVIPLEQWDKAKGYPFVLAAPAPELLVADSTNIRADWLEDKKLEVVSVKLIKSLQDYSPVNDYLVTFKEKNSGVILEARASGGQVPQVVLQEDLVNAQKYFEGKTIYSRRPAITIYQTEPGAIPVRLDEPLKITAVIPGVTAAEPIWLVVTTSENKKGYIAINYSNTNMYQGLWQTGKPWASLLLEVNPRETYNWDEETWASLNAGLVKPGMTYEQVKFVWGEPLAVTVEGTSGQSWLYPSKIVKFSEAKVVAVETRL